MKILNFINNQWIEGKCGQWLDNINPQTGEVYSQVVSSTSEDVEQAIEAASVAFPSWKNTSLEERIELFKELTQLMKEKSSSLAEAESLDQGKPVELAQQVDIPRAIYNFEFFPELASSQKDQVFRGLQGDNHIKFQPLGVVAAITPWNLPLYLLTWKLAPALITGNCVVAKPSELTPLTAFLFSKLLVKAGFPPGVVNIIHGEGTRMGDALTKHPQVKAVSFTGSTQTGTHIYAQAASASHSPKKVSLEMEAKTPISSFKTATLNTPSPPLCAPPLSIKDKYAPVVREYLLNAPSMNPLKKLSWRLYLLFPKEHWSVKPTFTKSFAISNLLKKRGKPPLWRQAPGALRVFCGTHSH